MLIVFLLIAPSTCQFASYLSLRLRLPGRCREGDFDCGFGHCIPVRNFHDGRADCMDGSDEWCISGQVKCGAYCVDFKDGWSCLFSNKCDGSSKQPKFCEHSKEKLCRESQSFPCKGYGECVLWHNLMDGQPDCIDGSDEDMQYVSTLEGPFRCYFNRTGQVQPGVVKYSGQGLLPPPIPLTTPPIAPLAPFCSKCPSPHVFPPPPFVQPTAHPSSFPTLIPSHSPDSNPPISAVSSYSTLPSPVQIQHITPISVTQSEPGYGDFFPDSITPSLPYPTRVDFTVEAHIKTVLPATTTFPPNQPSSAGLNANQSLSDNFVSGSSADSNDSHPTTKLPSGWTTDGYAHIKVIPDSGKTSDGDQATHIDLGTGQVNYGGTSTVSQTITSNSGEPNHQSSENPSTNLNGPVDGLFFPRPVIPITGKPAAIRPVPPYGFNTLRPIVSQLTTAPARFGTPDYNIPLEHLIPIRPGIIVPTAVPDGRPTTPKYPFPPDDDYESENFGKTIPTIKIGVIATTKQGTVPEVTRPVVSIVTEAPKSPQSSTVSLEETTNTEQDVSSLLPDASSTTLSTTSEITSKTIIPVGVENHKNTSCPQALLDSLRERYPSPFCNCDSLNSTECQNANRTLLRVDRETICDDNSPANDEDKARIILSMSKNSLPFSSCVETNMDDGVLLSVNCATCTLSQIQSAVDKYNSGPIHAQFEALNNSICSVSGLNNCHKKANCIVDPSGLRFHCVCKNGTTDLSHGRGLECFGIPAEDDCVLIFGMCMIVWMLLFLGMMFCCPLVGWMCWTLDRRRRGNIIHPTPTAPPKQSALVKPSAIKERSHKVSTSSNKSVMASVLVDALRNNAKGISAVSQSMTTKDRVRFTDEVLYPPHSADWRLLPETSTEPTQYAVKSNGISPSVSETKLSALENPPRAPSPAQSLAGTPVGAAETPILDRAGETARGTPPIERLSVHSLPIPPLEVPQGIHKTSLGSSQSLGQPSTPSPTPIVVTADVHQENQAQDNHSLVSVGVQQTIWETYRAVGVTGVDREREGSSSSLDDLIGKKFPESTGTSRPQSNNKEEKSTEISVPKLDLTSNPSETKEANKLSEKIFTPEKKSDSSEDLTQPIQNESKKSTASIKLAEMLGVTLDDHNDMQALNDMAEKKIDLPLEPEVITSDHLSKLEADLMSIEQEEKKKVLEKDALECAVLKELVEEEKRKKDLKHILPNEGVKEKPAFVPVAARKYSGGKKPTIGFLSVPRRGDHGSSTEESDPESLFQRQMESLKRGGKEVNPFKDRKRRYRKPERQLSSISEKSAEIASDAAIMEHGAGDFTVSAPNTTRSLSDWHAFIPKHRRFDGSPSDETDTDIPSRFRRIPPISSPEIPDVTKKRSRERLNLIQEPGRGKRLLTKATLSSSKQPTAVPKSTALKRTSKGAILPEIPRRSTANSRSSLDSKGRASIVSRKIATRKTEMRSSKSASDLTIEQQEIRTRRGLVSRREQIARSEEYLAKRPPWDYSPFRDGDPKESHLPPIQHRSTYSLRSVHVSPASIKKRTGSHSTIHTARSGSSISFSPYFDPKDPSKPPKEELWWMPHD